MMNRRNLIGFVAGAVVAATLAYPGQSNAFARRMAGASCTGAGPFVWAGAGSIFNGTTDNDWAAECGFPSDDTFPHDSVARIFVHVVDNHASQNMTVQACAVSYASLTSSCGASQSTIGTGAQYVELTGTGVGGELTGWQATYFFPYIRITLPRVTTSPSVVLGYIAQDT